MTPAAYQLSIPKFTVSAFRLMKGHISFLKTLCRFCGKKLSGENYVAHKGSFKHELLVSNFQNKCRRGL